MQSVTGVYVLDIMNSNGLSSRMTGYCQSIPLPSDFCFRPQMMDMLVQELTKQGVITHNQESQLIEKLNTQRVPGLPINPDNNSDSPISHIFSCQEFIDNVLSILMQVSAGHRV